MFLGTTSVWPVKKDRYKVDGGRSGRREYVRLGGNFHRFPSPAYTYMHDATILEFPVYI
jgi:hypothetical protein